MGNLEMDVPGVHNKEFYDMFNTLQANPTPENLKTVNDYITKLGGDPIELINGELVIPTSVTYK